MSKFTSSGKGAGGMWKRGDGDGDGGDVEGKGVEVDGTGNGDGNFDRIERGPVSGVSMT